MRSYGLRPPWCKCVLHNSDQTGINDQLVEFRAHYIQPYIVYNYTLYSYTNIPLYTTIHYTTVYYAPLPLPYTLASRWFMVRIQVHLKLHS